MNNEYKGSNRSSVLWPDMMIKTQHYSGLCNGFLIKVLITLLFITLRIFASDTLRFLPHWRPQAQFAGFFVAEKKGFYTGEGLNVILLEGGPGMNTREALKNGTADIISTFFSSALTMRNEDFPLINICQYSQQTALMLISKKSRYSKDLTSLRNKRIGLWHSDFREIPLYFFRKHELSPEIIPVHDGIQLFLHDGVDGLIGMWYNEYHRMLATGIRDNELNRYHFFDFDLNMPEDGLYCTEVYYEKNPETVKKFVRASLRGWQYAFNHPEEALEIVTEKQKEANLPANRAHERYMLECMRSLFKADETGAVSGYISEEAYIHACRLAMESGIITSIPPYKIFMKTLSLEEP